MDTMNRIMDVRDRLLERLSLDTMTPLERLDGLRRFEEPDRMTGSVAFWTPAAIGIDHISPKEYYEDPEKMYYCQLMAMDRFGYDYPLLIPDIYDTEPEALGAKIAFSGDGTPRIVEPALNKKEDLDRVSVIEPLKQGRMPYRIEIARIHHETFGKWLPTLTSVSAPFSMAVGMRGYEALVIDMLEDPEFVHRLLEFCCQVIVAFGNAIKDACGTFPSLADAWSSIPNLSHEKFLKFSFPYASKCFKSFGGSGWSFGGGHQFSSDWEGSLRRILSSGCTSLMLFEENITGIRGGKVIDLRRAKGICEAHGVFLFTGIHPETMFKGPVDRIESLMTEWIRSISAGGGHGFYTSILPETPFEHIEHYVRCIKKAVFPIQ